MCHLIDKYNVPGPRYTSYPTVPFWDQEGFSEKEWRKGLLRSFEESNGSEGISLYIHLPFCESMCTFCGCHKRITKRHEVEVPYIHSILREWDLYIQLFGKKPRIKELHLGGGTPTFFSPDNLLLLICGLFANATKAPDAIFSFEGHPNNTTKRHLQTLYNIGFSKVSFGIQDYADEVQRTINRIQPYENVRNVTLWAREIGYASVGHDIIYGLPKQTLAHVEETIAKTKALMPDRLAFYSYAHVPWLKGNGQRGYSEADLPSAALKQAQYGRGKELLTAAGYHDIGMDHFALENDPLYQSMANGQLHRNFMGYTPSKTQLMVGLGVSSIGDTWYGFAQNVKNLEEYQDLVSKDIIPIYRGHILSQEDQTVRRHILNLMCRFHTQWKTLEGHFPKLKEVLSRLHEMEKDGLLILGDQELRVTDKGKPYIRNICMAFDVHLYEKQPEQRLFSMTV